MTDPRLGLNQCPHRGPPNGTGWAVGPKRSGSRGWGADERGALLILTGILLVLAFVVLGTTLVQLNASEDKVTRSQRDPMMESVDALVRGFSQGIRGGVELGDTNLAQFTSYTAAQQELFRDTATQVGLYVDVKLNPDPPLNIFVGPNKCGFYDNVRSQGGIILGFEKDTLTETIVGAVYTMNFTDGRQSVTMDYYVKIFDCTPGLLSTSPDNVRQHMGGTDVTGIPGLKDPDDEHAGLTILEELTGEVVKEGYVDWKGIVLDGGAVAGWNNPERIEVDDGSHALRPSPPLTDVLYFDFTTTTEMEAVYQQEGALVFNDFDLIIDTYHQPTKPLTDDDQLSVHLYNVGDLNTPLWSHTFPTLATTETRYTLNPPAPSGNPEWTRQELLDSVWQLTLKVNGLKDDDHSFHVDFIRPFVTYTAPQGHQMNIEFEWKNSGIPYFYRDHVAEAVYRIPGATAGEEFQMQTWNLVTEEWEDLGAAWTSTGASWLTWSAPLTEGTHFIIDGDPDLIRLRLIDKNPDDAGLTDRDTVYIDHLRVTSQAVQAP